MKIEVSHGELIDKLSILEIKAEKISVTNKLLNIQKELKELRMAASEILPTCQPEYEQLKNINNELWNIEDRIREFEKKGIFNNEFIQTARAVYQKNDIRAAIKKRINQLTNSFLSEEKSYQDY